MGICFSGSVLGGPEGRGMVLPGVQESESGRVGKSAAAMVCGEDMERWGRGRGGGDLRGSRNIGILLKPQL